MVGAASASTLSEAIDLALSTQTHLAQGLSEQRREWLRQLLAEAEGRTSSPLDVEGLFVKAELLLGCKGAHGIAL